MPAQRLVILDRDGVINEDSPTSIRSLAEWRPIVGSIAAITRLSRAGWTVAVATNQSGIARGFLPMQTLDAIHEQLRTAVGSEGGTIATIAVCPHRASDHCVCRKPRPGLIERIALRTGVSVAGAPFVGDSLRDVHAALAAGCLPLLVRTGNGQACESRAKALGVAHVFDDLRAAAEWLVAT